MYFVKTIELDIRFNQLGFGLCQFPVSRAVRQVQVQVFTIAPVNLAGQLQAQPTTASLDNYCSFFSPTKGWVMVKSQKGQDNFGK
ncbi:hypothetical protein QUA81_09205 [Microcoleus sp. F6_B4]